MGNPNKHPSLCWNCEWAGGKDGKCPWATEFKPVPGWKAEPTKLLSNTTGLDNGKCIRKKIYVDSFDVYDCPLFEFAEAIKRGIVKSAGKRRFKK